MTDMTNISVNAEGYMTDANQWTREIAEFLAKQEGINVLTPEHWKIIEYCRETGVASGKSPRCGRLPPEPVYPPKNCSPCSPKVLPRKWRKSPVWVNLKAASNS